MLNDEMKIDEEMKAVAVINFLQAENQRLSMKINSIAYKLNEIRDDIDSLIKRLEK